MRRTLISVAAGLLLAAGCGTSNDDSGATTSKGSGDKGSLVIGAFNFSESELLANMYADVLNKAGFKASVKKLTNREVVEPALERGDIQIVPEYLATLTEFLNGKVNGANPKPVASGDVDKTLAAGKMLAEPRGITLLDPATASDQNTFVVKKDFAAKNNLTKLSDLAAYQGKLVLGGPPECPKRTFCQIGLEKTYGIHFTGFKALDAGGPLSKAALDKDQVQIALLFSSDPSIQTQGYVALEDDKQLQNADVVVPAVNTKAMKPGLEPALDDLSQTLTTDDLVALRKKVEIDRQDAAKVAEEYLKEKGLV